MDKPRIYADFNSCVTDEDGDWCWCLRYRGQLLENVAEALGLVPGTPVTVYYEDESDEFEFDAVLGVPRDGRWGLCARYDERSFRRIR